MDTKSVEIELTTKCTIACPACPRTFRRKAGDRTWDTGHLDKNIVFEVLESNDFQNVRFVGSYGDCIYHPQFIEIMKKACVSSKKIKVETNGSHRNKKWWQQLSDLPWRDRIDFHFSIDGLEDTNHIYRKNSKWKQIMLGVETCLLYPSPSPRDS